MSVENVSPTRINLISTKKTLRLAESGRDILERKRDILLRELRHSVYDADHAREEVLEALRAAYTSLQDAQIATGGLAVDNAALGSSYEADFLLDFRSVMGVAVPLVEFHAGSDTQPDYGFGGTSVALDLAFKRFFGVLDLLAKLATAEGISFAIARDVKRTQRRVNALDHVLIPSYRGAVKRIELALEEKEREEFVRTKKIKRLVRRREKVEF